MVKLNIGSGKSPKEGFINVDQYAMEGVDVLLDAGVDAWPWGDNTVEELFASHFLEHLTQDQRVHFFNEACRVMAPGAKATIITPHWASNRAYGDPTHKWPAVSEMSWYYLKQEWRTANAPHTDLKWNANGFSCDFDATWGYSFGPELAVRNQEHVQFALQNYKEAAQDMHATITKPVPKVE
jgi:hypothetical protein